MELLQSKAADPAVAAGTRKLWCFPSVAGLRFRCCTWGWGLAGAGMGSCLLRFPMVHPLGLQSRWPLVPAVLCLSVAVTLGLLLCIPMVQLLQERGSGVCSLAGGRGRGKC